MGWVVKAWRHDAVEEAEREARRLRRAAGREAEDAAAYLLTLEELGAQLREDVRRTRRARAPRPPEPGVDEIRARRGRARLREGPLAELFRATG